MAAIRENWGCRSYQCIPRNEKESRMQSFWEKDFDEMWKLFRDADRIIGFNTLSFDIPAMRSYAPAGFEKLPHFDILDRIKIVNFGRGASLNALAKDTLGTAKIDSGANAVIYFKKGDSASLALLQKYCEADVAITRDIYDFAVNNKFLKFTDKWNNARQRGSGFLLSGRGGIWSSNQVCFRHLRVVF